VRADAFAPALNLLAVERRLPVVIEFQRGGVERTGRSLDDDLFRRVRRKATFGGQVQVTLLRGKKSGRMTGSARAAESLASSREA
jgi:hypothetical protein